MRRRRLLATCGTLLGGPGCVSPYLPGGESPTTGTPTDAGSETPRPTAEPTPDSLTPDSGTPGVSVTLSNPSVQSGFVHPDTPDSIAVADDAGQYLLVRASVAGGTPPDRSSFAVHFDGGVYDALDTRVYRKRTFDASYANGEGWLVFALPETGDADDARIAVPWDEWDVPPAVRERLAAPMPTFDVSFWAPETVGPNETPQLSLTITNESAVPGPCVLALTRSGPRVASTPVARMVVPIESGETVTADRPAKSPYDVDEPARVTYRLDYPGGDDSVTIDPVG